MTRFAYIHGFNSGAGSRSARLLDELTGAPVLRLAYDYAAPFRECLASLERQLDKALDPRADRLILMGCSLGGFYSLQLRHPAIAHVLAWNPAVFPALQLRQFLGRNTRFSDGVEWTFTEEACRSYAKAPDPRPWRSCAAEACPGTAAVPPARTIFLGDRDEVLDSELAQAYWEGHADIRRIHAAHSIEDYTPMAGDIMSHA